MKNRENSRTNRLIDRLIRAGLALLILLTAGSTCEAAAMKIERVTSASGIEAWLVRDHSIPVVTLRFTFVGGASLDPPGKDGSAALAASLLDEGAGEYDTTAFHRRLDELAAEMSFSAGHDEFDGTLRMLKANREESADLLRVALTEPHFADVLDRNCLRTGRTWPRPGCCAVSRAVDRCCSGGSTHRAVGGAVTRSRPGMTRGQLSHAASGPWCSPNPDES